MEIGERIKIKRLENKMTLLEVANLLGVKEATVQRYESGEIRNLKQHTIARLAEIFHTTPAYLMGWEEEKDNDPDAPYQLVGHGLTGGERLVDTPKHAKISEIRFYLEQLDETQLDMVLQFVKFTASKK